jgi:hypothetical protein
MRKENLFPTIDAKVEEVLSQLAEREGIPRLEIQSQGIAPGSSSSTKYFKYGEEGDYRCAYVRRDSWERPHEYLTEINYSATIFAEKDLREAIKEAFDAPEKRIRRQIEGVNIFDQVTWEDSISTGPCRAGPEITDTTFMLTVDVSKAEAKYEISRK